MAILKVKDKDGNVIDIPAIKGADGKDGVDGKDYVLTDEDKQEIANLIGGGSGGGTFERPTETKTFLNDFSYEANMDASSVVDSSFFICALYDESNDLSNKEIAKIEYNSDSENWIDVKDIIQIYPTFPYTINVNRSFRYTDSMGQDCVCFGVLGFLEYEGNQLLVDIRNQSQYGFRVTYYTD